MRGVGDHTHAKSDGATTQFTTDSAHADYAQRFVVKLDSFEILFVPFLPANVCIGLRNLSRYREQQRKRMFGSRKGVSPRRVEHNDAAARRRLNIDIIHAHSRAANHAKF